MSHVYDRRGRKMSYGKDAVIITIDEAFHYGPDLLKCLQREALKPLHKGKVYKFWSDYLEGRKGWFANDIATLSIISKEECARVLASIDGVYSVCHKGSSVLRPFHSELREKNWRYFKEDKYRGDKYEQRRNER